MNETVKKFIDSVNIGIILFNERMLIEFVNEWVLDIFRLQFSEVKGKNIVEFVRDYFDIEERRILNFDCESAESMVVERKGGSAYLIRCFPVSKALCGSSYLMTIINVDSVKEYRKCFSGTIDLSLVSSILEFIPDILFAVDTKGRVVVWNSAAEELTGIRKEDILGKGNYEYAIAFYGERRPMLIDFALRGEKPDRRFGYKSVEFEKDTIASITENALLKGRKRILWEKARRFYNSEGKLLGAIEVVRDITKIKQMEKKLKFLAMRDPLTKLYNRRQFEVLLRHEIERAKRTGSPVSVIYIDVDDLKKVNDAFGHKAGDELLKKVAGLLKRWLRKSDIVARVGGDEFVAVLPGICKEDAEKIVLRIVEKSAKESKNFPYDINFSYGIVEILPDKNLSASKAVVLADREMYKMKKKKKSDSLRQKDL